MLVTLIRLKSAIPAFLIALSNAFSFVPPVAAAAVSMTRVGLNHMRAALRRVPRWGLFGLWLLTKLGLLSGTFPVWVPPSAARLVRSLDVYMLLVNEFVQSPLGQLHSGTTLLHASPRSFRKCHVDIVNPDHSRLKGIRDLLSTFQVTRPDRRSKPVSRVIGRRHSFFHA